MRQRLIRPALLLVALCLVALPALADYKESYRKGIQAADYGKWSEVKTWMEQAIAEQPSDSPNKVSLYGNRFDVYIPHYYLGLALYRLGDCTGALRELGTSVRAGVVKGGKLSDAEKMVQECQARLPAAKPTATVAPTAAATPTRAAVPTPTRPPALATPTTPALPTPPDARLGNALRLAEDELRRAEVAWAAVAKATSNPDLAAVWRQSPELATARDSAASALERSRVKLASGRQGSKLADLEEAASLAGQARQQLEALPAKLEDRRRALAGAPVPTTPAVPLPTRPVVPPPGPTSGTPPALRAATQAFVAGDYDETVTLLAEPGFANPRAAALAHLLRAAARYQEHRAGGGRDSALREAAADDVRACRRLDPEVSPRAEFFSPSFVAFFEATR